MEPPTKPRSAAQQHLCVKHQELANVSQRAPLPLLLPLVRLLRTWVARVTRSRANAAEVAQRMPSAPTTSASAPILHQQKHQHQRPSQLVMQRQKVRSLLKWTADCMRALPYDACCLDLVQLRNLDVA
jgi:hypothetical protein